MRFARSTLKRIAILAALGGLFAVAVAPSHAGAATRSETVIYSG